MKSITMYFIKIYAKQVNNFRENTKANRSVDGNPGFFFFYYNNLDFREKHRVTLYFRYMCAKLVLKISRKYENIICVDGNPSAGTQHV